MARQGGRAKSKSSMSGKGTETPETVSASKALTRKGRSPAVRAPRGQAPAVEPLVEKITHEIFQTRAAYRADLFAYERDEGVSK